MTDSQYHQSSYNIEEFTNTLPLIIKKYPGNSLSSYIHLNTENS